MTLHAFTNPIFGIFTCHSASPYGGHTFGVLFDRADDGRIIDFQVLDYRGCDFPKLTNRRNDAVAADSGVLIPITREAADAMLQELHTIHDELNATPKVQRYHYASSIRAPSVSQMKKGRAPTNCTHFTVNLAARAGIDVGAIDYSFPTMDQVTEFSDALDALMETEGYQQTSVQGMLSHDTNIPMRHCMKTLGDGMHIACFRSDADSSVLDILQALPLAYLPQLQASPPVMKPQALTSERVAVMRQQNAEIQI